ncbi:MAG TPA: UbiA family prenyltransferase [Vicinamibacterales bacterium]|nr:UbiA family prenyltransferase [Vicinamibacterales bacterium]
MSALRPSAIASSAEIVCVDLDGTLIAGDLFWESLLRLVMMAPLVLFRLPFWALKGRAYLKRQIAARIAIDAKSLPYRDEVLAYLRASSARGSTLVLATGSDEIYARAVHQHLGLFDDVVASDGVVNMSGRRKAHALSARFGSGGFHYVGNDWADVHVWSAGGSATIVAAPARLIRRLRAKVPIRTVIAPARTRLRALVRALRPHQWAKNTLVFAPLIAAHDLLYAAPLIKSLIAFTAFSACASGIYILNDIVDVDADRQHPRKRTRPFAAGELSIPFGVTASGLLIAAGLFIAAVAASWSLAAILAVYIAATTAYSTWLKREPVVDVFVLAGLYVLRVVAGGVAASIPLSTWMLAFALFFFLSLAFVKRYTELAGNGRTPGRGYTAEDALWMHAIGTSSGYMAVVVLALYLSAPDVTRLYSRPTALWLLCPLLLFWITRTWFRAGRRQVHDDPVVEALKDPAGYGCAVALACILLIAL